MLGLLKLHLRKTQTRVQYCRRTMRPYLPHLHLKIQESKVNLARPILLLEQLTRDPDATEADEPCAES
jgi:hypothetical protein